MARHVGGSGAGACSPGVPKGSVAVDVTYWTGEQVQAYMQGAPGIQSVFYNGMITFDDVADFGPGAAQPVVGIDGGTIQQLILPLK